MSHRTTLRRRWLTVVLAALLGAGLLATPAGAVEQPEGAVPREASAGDLNTRVIVQFTAPAGPVLSAVGGEFGVSFSHVRTLAVGADVYVIDGAADGAVRDAVIRALDESPATAYAELDAVLTAQAVPNDTRYGEQWHYFEATAGINAEAAWDDSTGAGVVVAVIDTGYRPHADLDSKILPGYDFIGDTFVARDGDGRDADASDPGDWTNYGDCYAGSPASNSSWHGTHVAGTIAAETNNNQGVAGVAWGADILPVRVLGRCGGYTSDIADGIVWASGGSVSGVPANANPAAVLNLSLGGSGSCPSTTQSAVNTARANGSTVVVAAGNSNANAANYTPASCNGVISVASTDRSGNRAYYSNYGSVVDLAAPGGETNVTSGDGVLSTLNTGTTTPASDSEAFYQGTSMAAPHVAGVAALVKAVAPSMSPDDVEATLVDSARAFPGSCSQCGSGLLDAAAAVTAALGGGPPPPPPPPPPFSCPAGYDHYAWNLTGTGDYEYEPNGTYYYSGSSGTHSGILEGPAGTDFDLYLWKWQGGRWVTVDSSLSYTSSEQIDYYGSAGYYVFRIESYSGSGDYDFCLDHP